MAERKSPPRKKASPSRKPAAKPAAAKKKRVTFALHAPDAQAVLVTGSFCAWQTDAHPLKKDKSGVWKLALSLPQGRYEYRFLVDGAWCDDPQCTEHASNEFGTQNCVLAVK